MLLNQRYEIQDVLGRGGVATTYLAIDADTGHQCAIKCLSFRKVKEWKTWELFEREARILKNLEHPQIPDYLDFFTIETEHDVELYLVQEYVKGKSLVQLVHEGKHFTERETLDIALQVVRILEYLHGLSPPIVHRDIKPGNITLSADHQAYLIDFGAVKDTMLTDYSKSAGVPTIVGTYGYMPIEQFEGRALPASDIFSLGMTLIYLLSHREPVEFEKKGLHLDFRPHVNISEPFARILDKMIAPDWSKRYQTVSEVRKNLEMLRAGKLPVTRPRLSKVQLLLIVIAGFLLFTGAGGYFAFRYFTVPPPEPEVIENVPVSPTPIPTATPFLQDYRRYSVSGRIRYDKQPITDLTSAEPMFRFFHSDSKQHETPTVKYENGEFHAQGLSAGNFSLSVEIDANLINPNRYPGDFIKWGVNFEVPNPPEIVVDMAQIIHLTHPQDNMRSMENRGSAECTELTTLRSPVRFAWESLGEDVVYNYLVGTVDCVNQTYHAGSVVKDWTNDTEVTLDLPPSNANEKYALHIFAQKGGQQIGRLYIHDEGGSNWNYGFKVVGDEELVEPTGSPQIQAQAVIQGKLLFDGRPITEFTTVEPRFWFRNEDTGKEQSVRTRYEHGKFFFYDLPAGNFGVSVNIDANMQNPMSYPGDFRAWKPFNVTEGTNPELTVEMQKILRMTSPQDNETVMEHWGAECMEKISFRSPVTFRWDSLGEGLHYDYQITRMDCLNHYNSAGTVVGETVTGTEVTVNLPPSRDNECYGFHLYARKEGRRTGMLMTHGSSGYGWDYRFRVK